MCPAKRRAPIILPLRNPLPPLTSFISFKREIYLSISVRKDISSFSLYCCLRSARTLSRLPLFAFSVLPEVKGARDLRKRPNPNHYPLRKVRHKAPPNRPGREHPRQTHTSAGLLRWQNKGFIFYDITRGFSPISSDRRVPPPSSASALL